MTSPPTYRHTQSGAMTAIAAVVVLALVAAFVIPTAIRSHPPTPPYVWLVVAGSLGIAVLSVLTFSRMHIEIRDQGLSWQFGSGFPRFSLPLSEVASARIVRNPWFYGLGIHFTPQGWLYNVSGRSAVEIIKSNGGRFRLGTNEPDALLAAITSSRAGPTTEW
jgi:hypothetical protein